MEERTIRPARQGPSTAYAAADAFDNLKLDMEAISSTATLLSMADVLDGRAQDAFRGFANSLDAIIRHAEARSHEFMEIHRARSGEVRVPMSAVD